LRAASSLSVHDVLRLKCVYYLILLNPQAHGDNGKDVEATTKTLPPLPVFQCQPSRTRQSAKPSVTLYTTHSSPFSSSTSTTLHTTHSSPFSSSTVEGEEETWKESSTEHAHLGGGKGAGHNAQFTDYRAADRLSAPRGETLLPLPPQPQSISCRARGQKVTAEGWRVGARYVMRGHNTTQTVLNKEIKRAQGFCPWSPSRGARDQSSSACQDLPSRGEVRALHHQPAPALTLTTPCRGAHLGPWHLRLVATCWYASSRMPHTSSKYIKGAGLELHNKGRWGGEVRLSATARRVSQSRSASTSFTVFAL
jgi:hypothetical protein